MKLQAKAGATITTYVIINDDDKDTSLLGKADAIRLGIIKMNLEGEAEEYDPDGQGDEEVRRIRMMKLSRDKPGRQGDHRGDQEAAESHRGEDEQAHQRLQGHL